MEMLTGAMESIDIDVNEQMKLLWMTKKLDGSEDHLISEKMFTLVREGFLDTRNNLMQNTSPKSLEQLIQMITPSKSMRQKTNANGER